jgi:hypothetical protein
VRRPLQLSGLVLPVGVVFAFLLATNRWTAPGVWSNDSSSYILMADAAPGVPDGKVVGSAYAGRWIPHYLVGLLADVTGFSQHTAYWIAAVAAVGALAVVAAVVLAALGAPAPVTWLALLAFVAAPYSSPRETLLAPGLLQDEVFVLGLAIALAGLLRVRFPIVLSGALIALAGRQTALPALLVIAAWILLDERWRAAVPASLRRAEAATVVVSGLILYGAILAVTGPFTYDFGPDSPSDTIIFSPPAAKALASHVGRTLVPLLLPVAIIAATWLAVLRASGGARPAVGRSTWLCLALAAVIVVQPLVITPDYPGFSSNEQRLAGLGLLPLWAAAVLVVRDALARGALAPPARALAGIALAAVALSTLSHVYTSVGPGSLGQFVVLQLVSAAVLAGVVLASARRPGPAAPVAGREAGVASAA